MPRPLARRVTVLALALAAARPAAAETRLPDDALEQAAVLRDRGLAGSAAYGIVESLTTEVGPRMAGTEADARAVAWARAKFEELGFDRVRVEPVTFPVWHRGHEQARILGDHAQPLLITALGGSVGTGGQPLEAEVVRFDSLDALMAADAASVRGKIAFIDGRMERFRDGRGYGPAVGARSNGATEAARRGARAVLIRSIGTDSDRLPHTGMMRYAEGVTQIPAAALSVPDAEQLTRVLERDRSARVRLDIDAETRGEYTSHNVIGEIVGSERPEEVVLIGGHLDSWDLGTGAVDDATGGGITMAAGKLIASLPERPRRTVRVVAFANEEQGLLGARAYARAHADAIAQHVIGAESDFGAGRIYALRGNVEPEARKALAQIAEVLTPLGIAYEGEGGGPGPDIGPMAARGMAWAQLAQDGTDYFDLHHTANDTLDKVDAEALDQQAAAYAVFAYLAAEAEGDFGSAPKSAGEED
ncbi:M28 family peptidase [Coralloluteibacterium stylophorae]|uniref:Carboxypeptidase Q n=1 Tax=Coralloluteibacterium stylophorae TaxID=1776034 RepID=A0AAP2CDP8_9GAMM|nr:M28 family peptidase [Coralloluteibacterium stylophorae]MBS7458361.1 M28 family peptidase [Coralloluteibacterium stylophorae]